MQVYVTCRPLGFGVGRPSHCYPQDLLRLGSSCRCPASSAPRVPATPPEKFKCKDQTERLSDEKPGPAYCARGPDPHVQANGWRPIADPRGFIRRAGTYLHRYREGFASLHFTSPQLRTRRRSPWGRRWPGRAEASACRRRARPWRRLRCGSLRR